MQLKEGHKTTSKQGVSKIIKEETKEPNQTVPNGLEDTWRSYQSYPKMLYGINKARLASLDFHNRAGSSCPFRYRYM